MAFPPLRNSPKRPAPFARKKLAALLRERPSSGRKRPGRAAASRSGTAIPRCSNMLNWRRPGKRKTHFSKLSSAETKQKCRDLLDSRPASPNCGILCTAQNLSFFSACPGPMAARSRSCRARATKESRETATWPANRRGEAPMADMAEIAWFENALAARGPRRPSTGGTIAWHDRARSPGIAPSSSRTPIWARPAAKPRRWPTSWRTMHATRFSWSATSSMAGN
jgi:hypothetical protein